VVGTETEGGAVSDAGLDGGDMFVVWTLFVEQWDGLAQRLDSSVFRYQTCSLRHIRELTIDALSLLVGIACERGVRAELGVFRENSRGLARLVARLFARPFPAPLRHETSSLLLLEDGRFRTSIGGLLRQFVSIGVAPSSVLK
jgi:hypothetical protein